MRLDTLRSALLSPAGTLKVFKDNVTLPPAPNDYGYVAIEFFSSVLP